MRFRAILSVSAVMSATLLAGASSASAAAPQTCTWGGTPVAPTGQNEQYPGINNTPSTQPSHFRATGPLGGQCRGTFVFDGIVDVGSTCSYVTFHGRAYGLPGVVRFAGVSVGGIAPSKLYGPQGNVVGSENAQFLSDPTIISACNSPQGVTANPFSSLIQLFGTNHHAR